MSYILEGSTIRRPNSINETKTVQYAQIRTLSGAVNRDYFGNEKKVWTLNYENIAKADYDLLNQIFADYLSLGVRFFQSTETNYSFTGLVHIDLVQRDFTVKGSNYLSSCTLILTEA